MRVLLVDDDTILRRSLCRRLALRGLAVDDAGGVKEALALLDANAYDAIVSDENMPDGVGQTLLARAAEKQPRCRRALMSGLGEPEGVSNGCWERFFAKPEGISDLFSWLLDA